jgi:uncharacterized protein (TIGR02996 family)
MQEADFIERILAHPDDEVARLAYADWLLEFGGGEAAERAEFIQVQCELARWSGEFASWDHWAEAARKLRTLRQREQALIQKHRAAWARDVLPLVNALEFRRGFVEHITLTAPLFLRRADRIFRLAPVQAVRLTTVSPVQDLISSPFLRHLRTLDLSGTYLGDAALRTLLTSPHLDRVAHLNLHRCNLSNAAAESLATWPRLAQLETLDLSQNHLTPDGVRALAHSPHRGVLRSLNLEGNGGLGQGAALGAVLTQSPVPGLLQSVLCAVGRREHPFSNARARDLARRAAAPGQAEAVLRQGLGAGHVKERAAAAQMLARLGADAAPGVPALVQRLYEKNPTVREAVARTLAVLLPALPAAVQEWLCVLAHPLRSAEANLQTALVGERALPAGVRSAFAAVCERRARWRAHNAGRTSPVEPPVPDDPHGLWEAAAALGEMAEAAPARHPPAQQDLALARANAREKEHAWLLARLCELLQAEPE